MCAEQYIIYDWYKCEKISVRGSNCANCMAWGRDMGFENEVPETKCLRSMVGVTNA